MKVFSKRGSAVLDAPEEKHAPEISEVPWATSGPGIRNPAPAGALHRAYADSYPATEEVEVEEAPYVPVRGKMRFRLRGLLRSTVGRVVLGVVVFGMLAGSAIAVIVARNYLLHDERFVIASSSQIEIIGNTHLTRAQVLDVFGEDVERNIFKVPLAQRRADLERLPWVQHATVMRLLPNTLRISVVERTPVAFVHQGNAPLGLADGSGMLLDLPLSSPGDPQYSFPVLTGLYASDPLSTRAARMAIYLRLIKDLNSSGEKLTETLNEVDITNPEDVTVVPIANDGKDILVHLGEEDFLKRYHQFCDHLPEWKQQYPKLTSVDMRYDRQVVLEMPPGTGATPDVAAPSAGNAPVPVTKDAAPAKEASAKQPVKPKVKAPVVKAKVLAVKAHKEPPPTHVAHRPAMKTVSAKGTSASNAKMFAALAAARWQQTAHSGQRPR